MEKPIRKFLKVYLEKFTEDFFRKFSEIPTEKCQKEFLKNFPKQSVEYILNNYLEELLEESQFLEKYYEVSDEIRRNF